MTGEAMVNGRWQTVDPEPVYIGDDSAYRDVNSWEVVVDDCSMWREGWRLTKRGARRLALRRAGVIR